MLLLLGWGLFRTFYREAPFRPGREIMREVQERACRTAFPVFSFMEEGTGKEKDTSYVAGLFTGFLPLYEYAGLHYVTPMQPESKDMLEQIIEGKEFHEKEEDETEMDDSLIEAVKNENEEAGEETEATGEFQEAGQALAIDRTALEDFDRLVSEFYAVDSTTYIGRDQLEVHKLSKDMTLQQTDASKPQILIYHTHSQEGFADSTPGDDNTTIMGAGERLAEILRTRYGFQVIHHLGKYDVESRDKDRKSVV